MRIVPLWKVIPCLYEKFSKNFCCFSWFFKYFVILKYSCNLLIEYWKVVLSIFNFGFRQIHCSSLIWLHSLDCGWLHYFYERCMNGLWWISLVRYIFFFIYSDKKNIFFLFGLYIEDINSNVKRFTGTWTWLIRDQMYWKALRLLFYFLFYVHFLFDCYAFTGNLCF